MSTIPTLRPLRPMAKLLPEAARRHNRALVLQTLLRGEGLSRADVARATGLTRVTVSDLVADLIADGMVTESGPQEGRRPGKPATVLTVDATSRYAIGLDLADHARFRGALLGIDGRVIARAERTLGDARGEDALALATELARELARTAQAHGRPLLGVGVGSPGVVDPSGTVLSAPNLRWSEVPLQAHLAEAIGAPAVVVNDAHAAVLAEHGAGEGSPDMMLVAIGHGVGAGLIVGGSPVLGARSAAGEIGHVTIGSDVGPLCACGKHGCLEAWASVPRMTQALADAGEDAAARGQVLHAVGERLGMALAPVVGALDLDQIVLSGPDDLLLGEVLETTRATLLHRTRFHEHVTVRMSELGEDIVLRGAGAAIVSHQLGVS